MGNLVRTRVLGLCRKPLADYEGPVKDCRCNLRKVLQRIEAGEMLA
jgi:hypothetical protein